MRIFRHFKKENLAWYLAVWNMLIISLSNFSDNKSIASWISLGNLIFITTLFVFLIIYYKRNNIVIKKPPLATIVFAATIIIFSLWVVGKLG